MTALELKQHLQAIDNKIVRMLTRARYKNLTGSSVKTTVVTDGEAETILNSINNYDKTVLTQLVVSSSAHISNRILKIYSKTKKQIEAKMRTHLHNLRNMKAKIKNGR